MKLLTRSRVMGLALAAAIFVIDQALKWLMIGPLRLQQVGAIELLPFFDLRWTQNFGVSLGMLTADSVEARWMLVFLTGVIALAVMVWLLREEKRGDIMPLAMVLGGALGNIRDRATLGYVVDFADLHFGTFRPFLIFNLADAAITVGVVIILARSFLSREKPADTDDDAADPAPES